MEFIFYTKINIKVCKSDIIVFMEVARHAQSILNQSRKLVIFLQYPRKKSATTAFRFYCDAKYSDVLRGFSHARYHLLLILIYSFPN